MSRTALLMACCLLAACAADVSTDRPVADDEPEAPAVRSSLGDDFQPVPLAETDEEDPTPEEEDPTPAEEEIGISPGDSEPGVPGVMTGLRARVAWNDGHVYTPPQEITLLAPLAGMPGDLPTAGELTPEQIERMDQLGAVMKSRLQPVQAALPGSGQ